MTQKLHGAIRPTIHRFTLGEMEITTILDGAFAMGISPPFLLEETEAEVSEIAAQANLPTDQMENGFVPVVINTGAQLVLIDTGFGPSRRNDGAAHLRARMIEAGYAPEDIDVVFITHVHPDHIGGIWEGDDLAFPNAQLMIGRREFEAWEDGAEIPPERAQNRDMFLKVVAPLKDRFRFLEDGDALAPGVVAEAAFGHSPGHMMVRATSGAASVLIWADVANHYVFSVEHPNSKVAFDNDKDMAIATRNRVLADVAENGTLVVGHHMPFPAVGYVQKDAGRYRWVPATYQLWL